MLLHSLLALTVATASAASFHGEDFFSITVPVQGDHYAAGQMVGIQSGARVDGDFIAAGQTISIGGDVSEDVIAVGSSVRIDGGVGDDVRIAAGTAEVRGVVRGDVLVFGGEITIDREAIIEGDLIAFGGSVTVLGDVRGNAKIQGGRARLEGSVQGNLDISADIIDIRGGVGGDAVLSAREIAVDSSRATFSGNVRYWNPEESLPITTTGTVTFDPELARGDGMDEEAVGVLAAIGAAAFGFLTLAGLLVILILLLATKNLFLDAAKVLRMHPWRSFFAAFIYIVATPLLAALLMVTVIGIPIGLAMLVTYGTSLLFMRPLAAIVLARWLEHRRKGKWSFFLMLIVSFGIYIVLKLLIFIPILGWIVCAVAMLLGFGALLKALQSRIVKMR